MHLYQSEDCSLATNQDEEVNMVSEGTNQDKEILVLYLLKQILMEQKDIDDYRKSLDSQIQEKTKEIDTNISYIIIGSLGFFITMLDKFIDVRNAYILFLMFVSFISLLISFTLFLYSKHLMTKHTAQILDFVDDKLILDPSNTQLEKELLNKWKKSNRSLTKFRNMIYVFLGIGVISQVIFFTTNIFKNNTQKNVSQTFKIEISTKDTGKIKSIFNLNIDTLKTN